MLSIVYILNLTRLTIRRAKSMKLAALALAAPLALVSSALAQAPGTQSPKNASPPVSDPPEANPGRPTVSTPATLTPVGFLQFETGLSGASHSPEFSSRFAPIEVMKFSVHRRLELFASSEPIVHSRFAGQTSNRVAEVFLGAQAVLLRGERARPTLALSYFRRVYDGGAPEFDFGSSRNSLVLLASAEVQGFHYDANAMFNEQTEGVVSRAQFGQSLTVSHPLKGKFTLSGEIWHFTQPFERGHAVGNLWALSYAVRRNLVLDAGFNRGLTDTSTRWEAFLGFTYLLPKRLR